MVSDSDTNLPFLYGWWAVTQRFLCDFFPQKNKMKIWDNEDEFPHTKSETQGFVGETIYIACVFSRRCLHCKPRRVCAVHYDAYTPLTTIIEQCYPPPIYYKSQSFLQQYNLHAVSAKQNRQRQ